MNKLDETFHNDANSKFLDPRNNFKSVALSIYPELDNYMVRYFLECVTGIITGSDTDPDSDLGKLNKERGFEGEGVLDNKTWIKLTRFPETKGIAEFDAHKCILVCRNLFSLIWALFEKEIKEIGTTLTMEDVKKNEQLLGKFIHTEGEIIHEYFEYWLNAPIPLYILRIEDFILNPENVLRSLLAFLLGIENIKGSAIENRMITFLKYNKSYTTFLQESLNQEETLAHFSTFQKNLVLKLFQDDLEKLGYINPNSYLSVTSKKIIDEKDLAPVFDVDITADFWYKTNNEKNKKLVFEAVNKHDDKYVVSSFLKLNNKEPLRNEFY